MVLLIVGVENVEVLALQAVGQALAVVQNSGVQDEQVYVHNDLGALLVDAGILARRRRRLRGNGNLSEGGGRDESERAHQKGKIAQRKKETTLGVSGWVRSNRFLKRR